MAQSVEQHGHHVRGCMLAVLVSNSEENLQAYCHWWNGSTRKTTQNQNQSLRKIIIKIHCSAIEDTKGQLADRLKALRTCWEGQPKRRQNITVLTTLPQGWVSTRKHQCTTAITTMWTESSSAFPENYTGHRWQLDHALEWWDTKRLITPPPIIRRLCHCMIAIMRV